ncbi:MAG: HypC/HybG/HupF family hydrogenase formation chaperone [Rhodomicrobium sp.]
MGLPMQVVEPGPHISLCSGDGKTRSIDMSLVGEQPVGTWLLVFLDASAPGSMAKGLPVLS